MAINLNHAQYGAQFTEFVNLAARNAGDPDTIVCLNEHEQGRAPEQLLGPNGEARVISVKDGDTIRPLLDARFGRSAGNKALNNQIRNLFLETAQPRLAHALQARRRDMDRPDRAVRRHRLEHLASARYPHIEASLLRHSRNSVL